MIKVIVLSMFLTACSVSDAISFFSPNQGKGIEAELVVGDKNQEVNTEIGRQEATTIVNNDYSDWFPYVLAMIALMLPTPTTMYNAWRNRNVSR